MRDTEVLVCFRPSCAEAYVLPGTRLVEAAAIGPRRWYGCHGYPHAE